MLYELLCERRPFVGKDEEELVQQILNGEPPAPRRLRIGFPRPLEAVVLKCLAKEPGKRFPSAAALADELQRWLDTGYTLTRSASLSARLWRQVRGHPGITVALVLLVVALFLTPFLVDWLAPNRPLREMQRDLTRGLTFEPIDRTGQLKWLSWPAGEAGLRALPPGERAIAFQTLHLSLLEVCPDPQWERYRFSAKVRHDEVGSPSGEVGLFFALNTYEAPKGQIVTFLATAFNDLESAAAANPEAPLQGNLYTLQLRLYRSGGKEERDQVHHRESLSKSASFTPGLLRLRRGPWRALVVEVTPTLIKTSWDGRPAHQCTREHLLRRAASQFKQDPELRERLYDFRPRGGLGFYLDDGEASFKEVQIVPLPTNE
jgi:serine/threonine-protein kinase